MSESRNKNGVDNMQFDEGFLNSIKQYEINPAKLDYRRNLTREERKRIRKYHLGMSLSGLVIGGIMVFVGFMVMNWLTANKTGDDIDAACYIGVGFFVLCVLSFLRVLGMLFITNYGVCDGGVLVDAYIRRTGSSTRNGGSGSIYVNVWFSETKKYCTFVSYYETLKTDPNELTPGDEIKIYRISNKITFAYKK